jgi:hypothetical protein
MDANTDRQALNHEACNHQGDQPLPADLRLFAFICG